MDEPRSIKALRDALLKLGLSSEEVQRFLEILGSDLNDSKPDEQTIRRICEEFADTLSEVDDRFGGKSLLSWRMAKFISGGLALGVLGDLISDLIQAGFTALTSSNRPAVNELTFAGGFYLEKRVAADTNGDLPWIVTGLKEVRTGLLIRKARAARQCGIDLRTFARAERGEPISREEAERIKIGLIMLVAKRGALPSR